LIWNAQELTGNRSYNASRVEVNTPTYAWVSDGNAIYHKRIDVRAKRLWENDTWLNPVDINLSTRTAILATLQPGSWGMKDEGGGIYSIYYRATDPANNPTTTIIRCDSIPTNGNANAADDFRIEHDYITVTNMELRGHSQRPLSILGASNVTLDDVVFIRPGIGPWISGDVRHSDRVTLRNVRVFNSAKTGAYIQGGPQGLSNLLIIGGEYSGSKGTSYNGSGFQAGDGDGIGIGQGGGTIDDLMILGITSEDNSNYSLFIGTSNPQTVTNMTLSGLMMRRNGSGCISDGASNNWAGNVIIAGFVCADTLGGLGGPPMNLLGTPSTTLNMTMTNGVFSHVIGHAIYFKPHVNRNITFQNLLFVNGVNGGIDIRASAALIGDEVFKNIQFYGVPNTHSRFSRIASTDYYYDTPSDFTAWVTATKATQTTINVSPLQ
jgi:hypothetical protein